MGWWNKLVRDKKQETVLDERFKDATPTSELVISANSTPVLPNSSLCPAYKLTRSILL